MSDKNTLNGNNKFKLIQLFKSCLDILRDSEHLTGDKALRTISQLLILKLIEPRLGTQIDIDSYNYNYDKFEIIENEHHKEIVLSYVRFSNLVKAEENDITDIMRAVWDDILSQHPKTKDIYIKGRGFNIKNQSTYTKLIKKLHNFNFSNIDEDIQGEAYEEVIKDIMTGKVLGQFFTPPNVKKMMVKLIDPQINKNGTVETIYDPALGTGGFLITSLRHFIQQSKIKKINLDWNFISTNLGGREAEPDTYQLAKSNMLISSGYMFNNLQNDDSIRNPITNKYDIILTNPPFGIKGLNYKDIKHELRDTYIPIITNSAVPLFIQAIIYMLKIGGRCAVVLPDGKELFSNTSALVNVRKYLMKTCDLKEVIYLPPGVFTHTSIKTCVLYFVKKKEGTDIINTNISYSAKTHKENKRKYVFNKHHQTNKVTFFNYDIENEIKTLLCESSIIEIADNNYSLNYSEYIKDEMEEYKDNIIVKKLGDVCEIQNGKRIVKSRSKPGDYPVYGGGGITFHTNKYSREGKTCKISREGMSVHNCVLLLNTKYYLNSQGMTVVSKDNILLNDYLRYYLFHNNVQIYNCGRGTAQKAIDIQKFKNINIPIPTTDNQKEIIDQLDFIYEKCIKTSKEKILQLNKLNDIYLINQNKHGKNSIKKIGDVCDFKRGKQLSKSKFISGVYPVIGGGKKPVGFHNEYNRDKNSILCSSSGSAGYISKYKEKIWASDCFSIHSKNNIELDNDYLYYYLKFIQDKIFKLQTGAAQPHIYPKTIESINIPIPTIDTQKEIIKYCSNNINLIKQLKEEIEQNKILAHGIFNLISMS